MSLPRRVLVPFVLAFVLLAGLCCGDGDEAKYYKVGDTVQDFTLPGVDGTSVALYHYQGSPILINFYASW